MSEAWREKAACKGADTRIFFPIRGESMAPARAYCTTCPVILDCRRHALATPGERWGLWGGLSERQRRGRAIPVCRKCGVEFERPTPGLRFCESCRAPKRIRPERVA